MRASHACAAAVALLAIGGAGRAAAQSPAASDRVRIGVNAGAQLSSTAFDASTTRVVYLENAVVGTTYKVSRGLALDGGIGVRLAGGFGVGVAVSSFTAKHDGDVTAALPHPFFFRSPRTVTGTAPGPRREEIAAHVQAIYTLHPAAKVDVALSAGPSYFRVRQDVVTDISFSDVYPYDTAAFTSAVTQRVAANKMGFNAGADAGVRLARHAGLGISARFSRATVSLAVPNSTAAVPVDAGGVQIAGGLRLYF